MMMESAYCLSPGNAGNCRQWRGPDTGKGAYREIAANPPHTKSKTIIKYVLSDAKQVSLNPSPPPSIPPTKTQR